MGKWVLKEAVRDIVPYPIIERPKSGMMVPLRFWLKKDMKRFARKILSKKRLNQVGYFNTDYIQSLINIEKEDIQSARNGLKLWMLITFMLWHEQMVENRK